MPLILFRLQENPKRFDRGIIIRCRVIHSSSAGHDVFIWNGRYLFTFLAGYVKLDMEII